MRCVQRSSPPRPVIRQGAWYKSSSCSSLMAIANGLTCMGNSFRRPFLPQEASRRLALTWPLILKRNSTAKNKEATTSVLETSRLVLHLSRPGSADGFGCPLPLAPAALT